MKSEDGPSAGQSSPRPSLPDTSKELLRKLAEELLLLHGQAEAAEARATAAEARATAAEAEAATLQQRLDDAQAAGDQVEGGAAPNVQQLLADAKRRARLAEADAAAAQSEAASLRVQLTDTQQQLAAARQEAAAARQRAAEAEEQLAEARRQAEAERLQAMRAADEAAAVERQLQEARRQLEERAAGSSAPLGKPVASSPRQRPEEVLTLRPKLEEERRLRRKAEAELEGERRQRQAAEALARSLQGQAAERPDGAARQRQQGLPAQAAAALAPEGTAAPSVEQQELDEEQQEEQLSLAATEPQVDIDLAAEDEGAADMEQQRRQGSGDSTQHPGTSSEGGQAGRGLSGGAAGEPAAAALGAAARQRQPAGDEGMRPPPQRLARLRGPMRPAGSGPTPPAAESPVGPSSGGTAPHHHKRKAERAAGDAAAPASAPSLTVTTCRHSSGGTLTKRHRGVVEPSPSSPGDSALDVAAVLQRQLRSNSAAAAAATTPAGPRGATALLAAAEQEGEEEGEEEGANGAGGRGRRSGRRSAAGLAYTERGVSGGGVVLKRGESAKAWLNRSIAAYVASLATSRDFEPFRRPVDMAQVPDYLDVVQQPMDLGTIRAKATEGRYRSPREFQSDLQLVVSNAQKYNESPRHPLHQVATLLMDTLQKPHSFYSKVADQFRQAETTATLAEEKARQEAEIEALERRLAAQVRPGLNLAVYAEEDNEKNKYFLMRATKPTLTLTRTEVDDFGNEFKRGDKVVVGQYYDYWTDARGKWDRSRRPYYLQDDRTAYVPASSLLLVDFELHACEEPELSPYSGREERIYEMSSDLHKELRKQIKKMTAEPAVLPGSP